LEVKRFVAQEYSLKVMSFFHSTACDSGETGGEDAPFGYWVLVKAAGPDSKLQIPYSRFKMPAGAGNPAKGKKPKAKGEKGKGKVKSDQ